MARNHARGRILHHLPKGKMKIPGRADWAGYENDFDVRYAHKLFFGKSTSEVLEHFGGVQSIGRADELLFMPKRAFQYYIFAFAEFLLSDIAAGDPDSASPFLRVLIAREQRDPGSVAEIYSNLASVVDYVASHQEHYDADPNIYGNFKEFACQLGAMCRVLPDGQA
jgi:hypothetical protein